MRVVVGASKELAIRHESVRLGVHAPLRLLYASDLHLGWRWTRNVPELLVAAAQRWEPDAILLGGDLVDRPAALPGLHALVAALHPIAPVGAVAGNHDVLSGTQRVRDAVRSARGSWLPDGSLSVRGTTVDGTPGRGGPVLCGHNPAAWPKARASGTRLHLAGHLHGGQWVAFRRGGREFPAAWVYRWNGPRFEEDGATLLVSRGVADTVPIRWNCPRELLVVEIC